MTGRQRPYLAPEMHATYIYVIKVKGGGGMAKRVKTVAFLFLPKITWRVPSENLPLTNVLTHSLVLSVNKH